MNTAQSFRNAKARVNIIKSKNIVRGDSEIFTLKNLVFWTNQGGGLTEDQLFCKIVKTKLTFVNGQKCDETHNT